MPIPVWVPGQVLTASDVNSWFVPNAVTKPTDQNVTSSTVLVPDTALVLPVVASALYIFEVFLDYEGGTQGAADLKWGWLFPSGTTMRYNPQYVSTSGSLQVGTTQLETAVITAGSNGAGTLRAITMNGTVSTGSTAGNVQLQWAQGTSSGTATIVHALSNFTLQRTS